MRSTLATRTWSRAPIPHSTIQTRRRPLRLPLQSRPRQAPAQSSPPSPADPVDRIGPNQAGRHWPHVVGAQPKLLRRPDTLPGDLRGQPGPNPQPECHLSRPGVRRPEIGRETVIGAMPPESPNETLSELQHRTFDDALGRRIVDIAHLGGARGAARRRRLRAVRRLLPAPGVDGTPLWRAHTAMETLHPQWNGYGYTWRRDLNAIAPENTPTATQNERIGSQPLLRTHAARPRRRGDPRRCAGASRTGPEERDFPILEEFYALKAARITSRISFRLRRGRPTARREPESSIRSRPIAEAASATTTRRSCRRPCRRCRWR